MTRLVGIMLVSLTACSLVGGIDDDLRLRPGAGGAVMQSGGAGGSITTGGGGGMEPPADCWGMDPAGLFLKILIRISRNFKLLLLL